MNRALNANGQAAKASPGIYTALMLVTIVSLAIAMAICLKTLMVGYGLSIGDLLAPLKGA